MDYYTRLLWKNKMHSEIYNSNIPFEEKIRLQNILDQKHKGNFIKEYPSATEAAKTLNKKSGAAITEVCNGKENRKSIYGYIWKYKN